MPECTVYRNNSIVATLQVTGFDHETNPRAKLRKYLIASLIDGSIRRGDALKLEGNKKIIRDFVGKIVVGELTVNCAAVENEKIEMKVYLRNGDDFILSPLFSPVKEKSLS